MRYWLFLSILTLMSCATKVEIQTNSGLGTWEYERRFGGLAITFEDEISVLRGKDWCIRCENKLINDRGETKTTKWSICLDPISGAFTKDKEIYDILKGELTLTNELASNNSEGPVFKTEQDINVEMYFKFDGKRVTSGSLPNPRSTVQCLKESKVALTVNDMELRR